MWIAAAWMAILFLGAGFRVFADCSSFGLPFTDLGSETTFCAEIAEAYYTGITHGTSATTFAPTDLVPREQAAAFATRTLDAALARGSRRAALGQWWTTTPHYDLGLGLTTVGSVPHMMQSDGADIWVASGDGTVSRVRASDGELVETWTDAGDATGILIALGRVFVTDNGFPSGSLFMIDPDQPPGAVTAVATGLGVEPFGIAFDGEKIWTANRGGELAGSVSIITPGSWAVSTVSPGFENPLGILFDGQNMWVTDASSGELDKLNSDGSISQRVVFPVGYSPQLPVFDGRNIWVPCAPNELVVVRASDGAVIKTFSSANGNSNGLNVPTTTAFDGQRILVTNQSGSISLFRAADLSAIGVFSTPGVTLPWGSCSDGANFWVGFYGSDAIGRF
jgi:hypothetical protein